MQYRIVDNLKDGFMDSNESWIRLFLSGSAIIEVESKKFEVEACTLLFSQDYKVIELIEDLTILEMSHGYGQIDIEFQSVILKPELFQILYEVFVEGFGDDSHKKLSYDYVVSHCKQNSITKNNAKTEKTNETIYSYIEDHLDENLSLEFLANRLSCSIQTLRRKFKKEKKCSPTEYIQHAKMTEAKKLLEQSDMSILTIASKTGFSDTASFSHAFKKNTHCSPNEYRKSNKWLI